MKHHEARRAVAHAVDILGELRNARNALVRSISTVHGSPIYDCPDVLSVLEASKQSVLVAAVTVARTIVDLTKDPAALKMVLTVGGD